MVFDIISKWEIWIFFNNGEIFSKVMQIRYGMVLLIDFVFLGYDYRFDIFDFKFIRMYSMSLWNEKLYFLERKIFLWKLDILELVEWLIFKIIISSIYYD